MFSFLKSNIGRVSKSAPKKNSSGNKQVGSATLKAYKAAIMDLYERQREMNINSNDPPYTSRVRSECTSFLASSLTLISLRLLAAKLVFFF